MFPLPKASDRTRVARWMYAFRLYDPGLYRHSVSVGRLTDEFAAYLGHTQSDREVLTGAALLHDIGKLRIGLDLLSKPSSLTEAEEAAMRCHAQIGCDMLTSEGGWTPEVLEILRSHHERLDGTGYPKQLLAANISVPVRIVTLCDIYTAMTEVRPYGQSLTPNNALAAMAAKRSRIDIRLMHQFASMMTTKLRSGEKMREEGLDAKF